jgi:GGDEF domain-containing protein
MISLRKAANDMERLEELKLTLARCYALALKASGEYAVELDPPSTEHFRQRLQALEQEFAQASATEQFNATQASWREAMRNYRDQAREQMSVMRKDLHNAAAAMKVFAESVTTSGDEHEQQLRQEVGRLEAVAASDDIEKIRGGIVSSTGTIVRACSQLRRSHQVVVTQLQDEIRTLHQAMDHERSRTDRDHASGAWSRQKLSERIASLLRANEPFCILFVSAKNLRRLERQHSPVVITDALRGLVQQFDGALGGESMIGRWSQDLFAAILEMDPSVAMALSTEINKRLSVSYPVWTSGVAQLLTIETSTGIVDRRRDSDSVKFYRKLEQMAEAMTGGTENKPSA